MKSIPQNFQAGVGASDNPWDDKRGLILTLSVLAKRTAQPDTFLTARLSACLQNLFA